MHLSHKFGEIPTSSLTFHTDDLYYAQPTHVLMDNLNTQCPCQLITGEGIKYENNSKGQGS